MMHLSLTTNIMSLHEGDDRKWLKGVSLYLSEFSVKKEERNRNRVNSTEDFLEFRIKGSVEIEWGLY